MIEAWFDGACEPVNPGGTASYGVIIMQNGETLHECAAVYAPPDGGQTSNNVAEYAAFIAALEYLLDNALTSERVVIRGDSNLVVQQMLGNWAIRKGAYVPLARHAQQLLRKCPVQPELRWIPREENEEADRLSKAALADRFGVHKKTIYK